MSLTPQQVEKEINNIDKKTDLDLIKDFYNWRLPVNARQKQIAPSGNWTNWLILAGRGFGKTRR